MARYNQIALIPSVLDRLIDMQPDHSTEPESAQSVTELRDNVKRDLESLLNTRQARPDLMSSLDETATSILTYGLPDFTSCGVGGAEEQEELREAVERSIQRFEPRLRQIQVKMLPPANRYERTLHLVIDAVLWIDPEPVPVTFDTIVQPSLGSCQVEAK